jgi:hypothetical protein
MHATAGKGGFAIESAQAMFGPVFTGPTKGHRPGNAKIGNRGSVHVKLPFFRVLRLGTAPRLCWNIGKVRTNHKNLRNLPEWNGI